LKLISSFPSESGRFLSAGVADVNADGRQEVFLSQYLPDKKKTQTLVLEWTEGTAAPLVHPGPRSSSRPSGASNVPELGEGAAEGKLRMIQVLPWLTRVLKDADGRSRLIGQQLKDDRSFPLSEIRVFDWKNGEYKPGEVLRRKRLDWLYGFTLADLDGNGTEDLIYVTSTEHLRVQFGKEGWESPETYFKTSNRAYWNDRFFKFYSSPLLWRAVRDGSQASVWILAVRNLPRFGIAADAFGVYREAEIQALRWDGTALETVWKSSIPNYVADGAIGDLDGDGKDDWVVCVVGSSGKTSIWLYNPSGEK